MGYKEQPITGIYQIENTVNRKVYIGQSVDIKKRWKFEKQGQVNWCLEDDVIAYGIDSFQFSILERTTKSRLNEREAFYIKKFNSQDIRYGYNLTKGNSSESLTHNGMIKELTRLCHRLADNAKETLEICEQTAECLQNLIAPPPPSTISKIIPQEVFSYHKLDKYFRDLKSNPKINKGNHWIEISKQEAYKYSSNITGDSFFLTTIASLTHYINEEVDPQVSSIIIGKKVTREGLQKIKHGGTMYVLLSHKEIPMVSSVTTVTAQPIVLPTR
jgi:group I intron endonuclease